jgi:hypothetical protein
VLGNQQNTGVLLFTVYQRGAPPRTWPCGLAEHTEAAFSGKANSIDLFSPLGLGSEADVQIANLSVTLDFEEVGVRCTFAGNPVDAHLPIRTGKRTGRPSYGWSGSFPGNNGQPVALLIDFKEAVLQQPYGQQMAQAGLTIQ